MERTIDEVLYDKLRQTRCAGREMKRPAMEGGMPPHPGHGPHPGPGPQGPHMHHRGRMFPRERVLEVILNSEEGMHQKDILEEIHINPSSLSELIDKLEADHYVERRVDPADKRATLISLTEKGKARAYEVTDAHREACAKMFANLSDEEKSQLLVLLDKILIKD